MLSFSNLIKEQGRDMNIWTFLQAAGAATQTTEGGAASASSTMGFLTTVVPFVLIIAIFYFFLIRPQSKKQKETEKMISALKKGDKVVTIGGIHGVVAATKEKSVIIKVDDNCKIEFSRTAIAALENPSNKTPEKAEKTTEKESKGEKNNIEEEKTVSADGESNPDNSKEDKAKKTKKARSKNSSKDKNEETGNEKVSEDAKEVPVAEGKNE